MIKHYFSHGRSALLNGLRLMNFSKNDFRDLLNSCHQRKKSKVRVGKAEVDSDACAKDKILAMIFEKPSTRTRVSFQVGMQQLGGQVVVMTEAESQLGRG